MDNGHMTMESIVSSTISLYSFETTPFTIKALTTPAPNQNASRALTGVRGFGVRIRGLRCWTTTLEFFLCKARIVDLIGMMHCLYVLYGFFVHTAADLLHVSVDTAAGNQAGSL